MNSISSSDITKTKHISKHQSYLTSLFCKVELSLNIYSKMVLESIKRGLLGQLNHLLFCEYQTTRKDLVLYSR